MTGGEHRPFWRTKPLERMTPAEWESLCDRCGRCCLHKLRDEDTGELAFTNVACRLLDCRTGLCRDYKHRHKSVPDCVGLTAAALREIDWLPPTCAYRLLAEGKDLPRWHPLITGDPDSTRRAGVSVAGKVVEEDAAGPLEDHVTDWPGKAPHGRGVRASSGGTGRR